MNIHARLPITLLSLAAKRIILDQHLVNFSCTDLAYADGKSTNLKVPS